MLSGKVRHEQIQKVVMLLRQCEIQSRKQNGYELPNVSITADVSSKCSPSELLLEVHKPSLENSAFVPSTAW